MKTIDLSQYERKTPGTKIDLSQYKRKSQEQSNLGVAARSLGKGVLSNADILQSVAQFIANTNKDYDPYGRPIQESIGYDQEYIPTPDVSFTPFSERVEKGAKDYLGVDIKPRPSNAFQRAIGHAGEFGGGTLPFGIFGSAKNILARGANTLKTTGMGAAIGGTSGVAQEMGANPLAADITSSLLVPSTVKPQNLLKTFKNAKQIPAKGAIKLMGLSPKSINKEAATASKDLGIDLPAAALTDSTLTGLADQWIGKTPLFGNKLKKKYATTEEQTLKALDDIYEGTGPTRTPEIERKISNLYNEKIESLPKDASVDPTNTIKALDKIKINSSLPSSDEKNLIQSIETLRNDLNPTLSSEKFGSVRLPVQKTGVERLIGTKQSLNSIIKWDMDEGVKNQLRSVQKGLNRDIAEYGKSNPEWYETFKEADSLFGKVAKREKLENLLENKATNHATDSLSYNALSKAINNPKNSKTIQRQVTPEIYEKIQKLGTIAKAMAIKNSSVPNPSGTAITGASLGIIYGLATNPLGFASGSGMGAVIGAAGASHLLTDKKFLDLAIKFAEQGGKNTLTATALNKRIKDLTGYTAITLQREMQRREQEGE